MSLRLAYNEGNVHLFCCYVPFIATDFKKLFTCTNYLIFSTVSQLHVFGICFKTFASCDEQKPCNENFEVL